MKHPRSFLAALALLIVTPLVVASLQHERETASGITYGIDAADKVGFHGAAPTAQRSGAAQTALTDSTGGSTAPAMLAATTGVTTVAIPLQLASMTTSAADLVTDYTPGYKFKILAVDFVTTTLGTGTSASQTLNLEIGSTNVTGGVVNPTLTSTNTLGKLTSGTAVTAANTGTSTDTISVEVAASGTAFTAGAGVLLIRIQNMDTADAFARSARLENELRAALVEKGIIAGS